MNSIVDRMAPHFQITDTMTPNTAAEMMRCGILARVRELVAERENAAANPANKVQRQREINAQLASLNVVLGFVASIKIDE